MTITDTTKIDSTDADVAEERIRTWIEERTNGSTYREIGEKYGVSHERVRQVLKKTPAGKLPPGWVSMQQRKQLAADITDWLRTNGPVPAGVVHEQFDISSQRLSDLITEYDVPKEYIMAGVSGHGPGSTIEDMAEAVKVVWARVQEEEPGTTGLSVGLYDRSRLPGEASPASITSRFGWKKVCALAGVPTAGKGRPEYTPKWSDAELIQWIGRYTKETMAAGGRVTFDGYDQWRLTQEDAPSGAACRTRLRRAGYESWAAMVAAGTGA